MSQLYVLQDGMIDFQKNRAQYRAAMGLDEQDLDSHELESQIKERDIENEFVMVDAKNKSKGSIGGGSKGNKEQNVSGEDQGSVRLSHLKRNLEEIKANPDMIRKSHIVR